MKEEYIQAMLEREEIVSTYIGMELLYHMVLEKLKKEVKKSGIAVLQYPNGIKFGDEVAYLVVGIAGVGDEHLTILSNIAMSLEDEGLVEKLRKTYDVNDILKVFNK